MKKQSLIQHIITGLNDLKWVYINEFKQIFRDKGVMIIFFLGGMLYPLIYNSLYMTENIYKIPIAVVDNSASKESREFLKKLDATPEVLLKESCSNLEEASDLLKRQKVHGIIYFPKDFHSKIAKHEQAHISVYSDMSSFLYYKGFLTATNRVMLEQSNLIHLDRYNNIGTYGYNAQQLSRAINATEVALFNPGGGYASFLIPGILILIIHQTLFFGIGMLAGTAREENKKHTLIPDHLIGKGIYRVVLGRAATYFTLYSLISAYVIGLIPIIFNLPRIGNIWEIYKLMLPFLLSTIFFSMSLSIFIKNRETGFIAFLFSSVVLLFLSGLPWPRSGMPDFWRYFSYIFPATHGVQGYVKMNSTGATLSQIRFEYIALWIQTAIYFIIATFTLNYMVKESKVASENINSED